MTQVVEDGSKEAVRIVYLGKNMPIAWKEEIRRTDSYDGLSYGYTY